MNDVSIISYPGTHDDFLLSLTSLRSKYMVPFAGNHRIIDFTIRNAFSCGAKNLLVYSRVYDDLKVYIENHPLYNDESQATGIETLISSDIDVDFLYESIKDKKTKYFILYCGDNPGFIDFRYLFDKYKSKKMSTVLFRLKIGEKSSLAHTILITTREYLLNVIKEARAEKRSSPNVFEMVNNMLINKGVFTSTFKATYWPIKTIPDYYDYNMLLFKNQELFHRVYEDPLLLSAISRENSTQIGPYAKVTRSYIPDGCILNGTVENSIIFPGVVVAERAVVKNSIVLPYVGIGSGAVIEKSVLDEFTDYNQSDVLFNIGEKVRVGSREEQLKSNDYPKAIYNSITLIGKNSIIPPNTRIGGACYVASAISESIFASVRALHDGLSVEPEGDHIA